MGRRLRTVRRASIIATACLLLLACESLYAVPTIADEQTTEAEATEKAKKAVEIEPTAQSRTDGATNTPLNTVPPPRTGVGRARPKSTSKFPIPLLVKTADPYSKKLSADAIQLAKALQVTQQLTSIQKLRKQIQDLKASNTANQSNSEYAATRADLAATKVEVLEVIENVRLQIDFVVAEIEEEEAGSEELLQAYTMERDRKVNEANLLAFRTNGALWAIGEALDIPTNVHPALSIPSGTLGIIAGIVPSVFSIYAVRSLNGRHHSRDAYPNMLTKIYDYPTIPRNEYPEAVWQYLNTAPVNDSRSRKQIMMDHWLTDKNIHVFEKGENDKSTRVITGAIQPKVDLNLISDRLTMLREIKAIVLQMTRPLLELSMVVRGQKEFVGSDDPN